MKKMRKSASNVNNAVNLISGAYTLPLIDKLFSNSQRIENMDDVYFAITALVDTDRISEAFHMIRGLFGISGMEYPQEIAQLENEYYGAAEPPVRCGVSHLSGLTEPPVYSYSA